MLGKGLESLIPKKNDGSQDPADQPQIPTPASADFSLELPQSNEPQIIFLDAPFIPQGGSSDEPADIAPLEPGKQGGEENQELQPETELPPAEPHLPNLALYNENEPNAPRHIGAVFHIEVEKIKPNPHQPRKTFDEGALRELAASIREFGILQPLVVSKVEIETPHGLEVEYQLIAGERRLMAAKMLGLERVPAIIRHVDRARESLELAVIENIQRENLNALEMARAYTRLQEEFRLTQREIATKLGKSRESVANTMRLLDLPLYIQQAIEENKITESHGRLLLGISDPAAQKKLFDDIVLHALTTREVKHRVDKTQPQKSHDGAGHLGPELKMLQERLSSELGAPVKIVHHGDKGNITISFYSKEELESILNRLQKEREEY